MKKGSGSVVQKGTKWYARWRIQGKDVYGQARETYEDADRDRVLKKPGTTKAPAGHHPTLQEFAFWCMSTDNERYGSYGRRISQGTFNTNESIRLNQIEGSKVGRKKLKSIDRFDLINWAMEIKKLERKVVRGEVVYQPSDELASDAWRLRCVAFVSKLFTLAIQHGFIQSSPAQNLGLPQPEERINTILNPEEMGKCFEIHDRTDEIIFTLVMTGLRRGELQRMLWADIAGSNVIIRSKENKGGTQLHPLPDEVLDILHQQPKRGMHVFTTASGKPLGARNLTRDVKKRLIERGIDPSVRLHDLRGTFSNALIRNNVDIKTVQTLSRHKNVKTTIKSYLRSSQDAKRGAVESLVSKFKPEVSEKDRGSG
jgi:integrase